MAHHPSLAQFPGVARWSRRQAVPGLAYDWHGWAWVWLQLVKAGGLKAGRHNLQAILGQLQVESRRPETSGLISPIIGAAAAPIVAASAAALDPRFKKLLAPLIKRWNAAICGDSGYGTDLMRGTAGALLACAQIESLVPGGIPGAMLKRLHKDCQQALGATVRLPKGTRRSLGLAHGLAGYLLALELSSRVFSLPADRSLRAAALEILAREHARVGGGGRWPSFSGENYLGMHGWCNGAPGIALALLHSYIASGSKETLALANKALKQTSRSRDKQVYSFCCGVTGRAHILVEAYRLTGDPLWLAKAKVLAREVSVHRRELQKGNLFHGRLGYIYLQYRLKSPENTGFPGIISANGRTSGLSCRIGVPTAVIDASA